VPLIRRWGQPFPQAINIWSLAALLIAAGVLLPIIAILVLAFFPSDDIWSHLLATTLPRYLSTTLALMLCVGFRCCLHRRWHRVVGHAVSVLGRALF
jgi:ABC-type Fe3+ transport system permease subunit